jgi:serine/threonine-protein kinase/endoribonuclease IRE1
MQVQQCRPRILLYFLSDFSILLTIGCGSSGWRAPEQFLHGRQTRAVDMFSLGCVLFFCATGGKHPYGESFERDVNIVNNRKDLFLVENIPEALDLFSHLLDPNPDMR